MSDIYDEVFGETRKRNTINSKQKGNTNERACAKALKLWTGVPFVRVPASGGLRWQNATNTAADLICDSADFYFPLTVETKALAEIFTPRTLPARSRLFTIWEQVYADAVRSDKIPLAMLRSNGMPAGEYHFILAAGMGGSMLALKVPILFSGSNGKYSIIGFKFTDVVKCMPYATFAKMLKRRNFKH